MTNIKSLSEFTEEFERLIATKENPDEWYVLLGKMVGEYNVQSDQMPDDYEEHQQELSPEDRDATENVDGFMQIGMQGWSANAFADDCNFVGEYAGYGNDKLDTRMMNILLVHEDMLSEDALGVANGDYENEPQPEAGAEA